MTTSWSFNGLDLSTLGAITLLDDYLSSPSRKGGDQNIPKHHGSLFSQKFFDKREIEIGLAIRKDSSILLEEALDTLRKTLLMRGEKTLSNTRADGSVRTAQASVNGSITVKRESYKFARATVQFSLADPFFRSTILTELETDIDESPEEFSIENAGTVEECQPVIALTGPLTNPVISNDTNGCSMTYNGTIASPRIVTIQVINGELTALDDLGNNLISNLEHEGTETHFRLEPGSNDISVTSTSPTTGKVGISFYPPYF